jgi:hypothetical protein
VFYKPEKFDNILYGYRYIISILLVRNIKYYNTILDLVYKKREVYIVCTHKKKRFRETINKRLDFFKLIFGEYSLLESNSIVGLRTRLG